MADSKTPPHTALDHLVVAARTLDDGVSWVEEKLGLTVPRGGAHDHMATHNCVGRIGDDLYFEIIAINPDDTPDRTRWFAMDEACFHDRLAAEPAFLHHWAINTSDIEATCTAASHDTGPVMTMSRGDLRWKILVRDDGQLARHGILPTAIEWPENVHPSRNMTDLDIRLDTLTLISPDVEAVRRDLHAIRADAFCDVVAGPKERLSATFIRNGERLTL